MSDASCSTLLAGFESSGATQVLVRVKESSPNGNGSFATSIVVGLVGLALAVPEFY